jgi:hypothetical protein
MTERSTPLGAAREDLDAVESIVRAAGTSFYHGMRVLPPDRRHAMYAIYAFCRIVDDIADEAGSLEEKRLGLAAWRDNIAGLYEGRAEGPVTRVLVLAVPRFQLRAEDFIAVIDGMQTDAETVVGPLLRSCCVGRRTFVCPDIRRCIGGGRPSGACPWQGVTVD